LTNVNFNTANLGGAIFRDANLTNAVFAHSGCSRGGCYPTSATLTDADFAKANLTNADFGKANLTRANFRGANLANVRFATPYYFPPPGLNSGAGLVDDYYSYIYATLTDADLTAADARGATGLNVADATTTNLIWPDGHIKGLDLDAGGLLVVRDHDGNPTPTATPPFLPQPTPIPPIPITIDQHLSMGPGGTLRMVFEADAWDSTISFARGIPVALGGTLELTFAADVNPASQLGRTFDLFDWTGVNPTGQFTIASSYRWNLSNLYTTGEVTLAAIPEPASCTLVVAGIFFLTYYRRRKIS
jgi:hypothetical protein